MVVPPHLLALFPLVNAFADVNMGNNRQPREIPQTPRRIARLGQRLDTHPNMEAYGKLLATGKVKAIGVANYSVRYLEQLLPHATIIPAVNQIENHPSLPQQDIVDFCKAKGIHITAYSPLGSSGSPMLKEKPIVEVAEKRGVTPASVLLSYHSEWFCCIEALDTNGNSCERKFCPCEIGYPSEDKSEYGSDQTGCVGHEDSR
jgi:hypothetical protein